MSGTSSSSSSRNNTTTTTTTMLPITSDVAIALRSVVFGAATTVSRPEWYRSEVMAREPDRPLSFALLAPRNVLKPISACVQAYVIKHLLFTSSSSSSMTNRQQHSASSSSSSSNAQHQHMMMMHTMTPESLLQPNRLRQLEAMAGALADIFWKCGDRKSAVVALTSSECNTNKETSNYVKDSVTECLTLHEFKKYDHLVVFIKRNMAHFTAENSPGHLLILYGAVLSRGTANVRSDLQGQVNCLLTSQGEYTVPLLTLLLLGHATPFLHNGTLMETRDDDSYAKPQVGVTSRSDIGLLHFKHAEDTSWKIGSRFKTPFFPIWISVCNDNFGVLFSPSRELVRDYHAERNFSLHYVNMGPNQSQPTVLGIDTRYPRVQQTMEDLSSTPPLELLIATKWHSATVAWNGVSPFV